MVIEKEITNLLQGMNNFKDEVLFMERATKHKLENLLNIYTGLEVIIFRLRQSEFNEDTRKKILYPSQDLQIRILHLIKEKRW